jgi:hypothetical protein
MSDKLDKYRTAPARPAPADTDGSDYKAFHYEAHAQRRLRLQCSAAPNHMPVYTQLLDIIDNGPPCTRIGLVFLHRCYRLEGKNLDELLMLLQEEKVKRIVEFNADVWSLPLGGDAIITKIKIIDGMANSAMLDI